MGVRRNNFRSDIDHFTLQLVRPWLESGLNLDHAPADSIVRYLMQVCFEAAAAGHLRAPKDIPSEGNSSAAICGSATTADQIAMAFSSSAAMVIQLLLLAWFHDVE